MKKLTLMIAAGLITTFSFAQKLNEKDIPSSVKEALHKAYPNAKEVKWDKEGENYEASFDVNKIDNSALFDGTGNLLETEVEIELNQLPSSIIDYVKTHYSGQKIKEGAKITDSKGTITYEAEIKGMDLLFDSNGKFIKEMKD